MNNILLPDASGPRKIERRHCFNKMIIGTARLHGYVLCPECGYTEPIDSEDTQPKFKLTDTAETPMLVQASKEDDELLKDLPKGVRVVRQWEVKDGNYY